MLPVLCSNCKEVISVGHIQKCPKDRTDYYLIDCPNCMHSSKHSPQFTYGSPLNLALLGNWDGWQPFGTSYRGSGAIKLSTGNLYKIDRNTIDEVYVVGFIPLYQVPKGLPQNLEPFLKPLMDDLVVGFIEGYTIDCPLTQIEDYDVSATERVRVLLLCWLGDHPGQCEVSKCLNQGKCGCRRCKLIGMHQLDSANNHFYYGENRYHFRYPWAERTIESELDAMLIIEMEDRVSVRRTMSSTVGFTGTSILHKYLYPLYGFNILKHLVYDSFHTVCLNVVKNQLSWLLENKKVDIEILERRLRSCPWNHEMKDGRIPQDIGKDMKLTGYWKAESFHKFGFPVMECILEDIADDQAIFEIISLISRIVELHFYSGRNGWTEEMINDHLKLSKRLNIKVEEVEGLELCTISLHNLIHLSKDIQNFSASDNFWCAVHERAVKKYVKQSHNCKGVEVTFAKAESQREFLKSLGATSKMNEKSTAKTDGNRVCFSFYPK